MIHQVTKTGKKEKKKKVKNQRNCFSKGSLSQDYLTISLPIIQVFVRCRLFFFPFLQVHLLGFWYIAV